MIQHEVNLEVAMKTKEEKLYQHKLKEEKIRLNKIKKEFPDISHEDLNAMLEGDESVKDRIYRNIEAQVHEKELKRKEDWTKHLEELELERERNYKEKQKLIIEKEENKKKAIEEKREKERQILVEKKQKKLERSMEFQKAHEDNFVKQRKVKHNLNELIGVEFETRTYSSKN